MGFFIADYRIELDFADYFYVVNCIATMNFSCDAQPAQRKFEGFIVQNFIQHNPCNQFKSHNP